MSSWTFSQVYTEFLTYVRSCTFADLTDAELSGELQKFLERAIGDFRFPQVKLDYQTVNTEIYFTDSNFGRREVNVLIAYMKKYFFEWILSRENNFEQQYYDADTKTHSLGNLVQQMNTAYQRSIAEAENANYNYGRSDKNNKPRIGAINA